jgi:hypothetical protein
MYQLSLKQSKQVEKIEKSIQKHYKDLKSFEKEGNIFFNEEGSPVIVFKESGIKSVNQTKEIVRNELKDLLNGEITFTEVKYSTEDLLNLKKEVEETVNLYHKDLLTNHVISVHARFSEQKVVLKAEKLPDKLQSIILTKFKQDVAIKMVDEIPVLKAQKARDDDWNNLGGGIAVKNKDGNVCSTAGMATNGSDYFILTAGHCFVPTESIFYQYEKTVGRQHTYANKNGYDVGLIRVTTDNNLTGGRFATNKFLKLETSSTYDGSITGSNGTYETQSVCKTGFRTGWTCGKVYEVYDYYYDQWGNKNAIASVEGSTNTYALPGDSGATTYSGQNIVGIHVSGDNGWYGGFTRIVDVIRIYGIEIYTNPNATRIVY